MVSGVVSKLPILLAGAYLQALYNIWHPVVNSTLMSAESAIILGSHHRVRTAM